MAIKTYELEYHKDVRDLNAEDITEDVQKLVEKSGLSEGSANVFAVGTTASISTGEYEPNLMSDFRSALESLAPSDKIYEHGRTWGDDNGKSHIRAMFMGPNVCIPFIKGRLILGTYQHIVLLDFDVPARKRKVVVQIIGELSQNEE